MEKPAPTHSGKSLADNARTWIREDARRLTGDPMYQAPTLKQAASPFDRLASAGRLVEKRLPGGIIQVRTPDGTVYCLQPPPPGPADGPVQMMALPGNCP